MTPCDWGLLPPDAHSPAGSKIPRLEPISGPGVVRTGAYTGGADGRECFYTRNEREAGSSRPPAPAVLPLPGTRYRAAPSLGLGYMHGTRATESLDTALHCC